MNTYQETIKQYKNSKNESLLDSFRCIHNQKNGYGESGDKNYVNRKHLILELFKNYSVADKPLIKWLLKEELKGYEFDIPAYTTDLCAFMLYKHMQVADVYDLYSAKFGAGSDHQYSLDIELVFGINVEETKAFLKNETSKIALNTEILEAIEWYISHPDAKFKSREAYIHFYETIKAKHILADLENY
ncbi:hypothetical protein MHTCC0001_32550 [Flavobacteriaceae bacterium MHTCC 0001]